MTWLTSAGDNYKHKDWGWKEGESNPMANPDRSLSRTEESGEEIKAFSRCNLGLWHLSHHAKFTVVVFFLRFCSSAKSSRANHMKNRLLWPFLKACVCCHRKKVLIIERCFVLYKCIAQVRSNRGTRDSVEGVTLTTNSRYSVSLYNHHWGAGRSRHNEQPAFSPHCQIVSHLPSHAISQEL